MANDSSVKSGDFVFVLLGGRVTKQFELFE